MMYKYIKHTEQRLQTHGGNFNYKFQQVVGPVLPESSTQSTDKGWVLDPNS